MTTPEIDPDAVRRGDQDHGEATRSGRRPLDERWGAAAQAAVEGARETDPSTPAGPGRPAGPYGALDQGGKPGPATQDAYAGPPTSPSGPAPTPATFEQVVRARLDRPVSGGRRSILKVLGGIGGTVTVGGAAAWWLLGGGKGTETGPSPNKTNPSLVTKEPPVPVIRDGVYTDMPRGSEGAVHVGNVNLAKTYIGNPGLLGADGKPMLLRDPSDSKDPGEKLNLQTLYAPKEVTGKEYGGTAYSLEDVVSITLGDYSAAVSPLSGPADYDHIRTSIIDPRLAGNTWSEFTSASVTWTRLFPKPKSLMIFTAAGEPANFVLMPPEAGGDFRIGMAPGSPPIYVRPLQYGWGGTDSQPADPQDPRAAVPAESFLINPDDLRIEYSVQSDGTLKLVRFLVYPRTQKGEWIHDMVKRLGLIA